MKTALAIVALCTISAVFAHCPNQCSGHGRCNEFDKCECFLQRGTQQAYRPAYTGPDCSLRTCPTGIAYGDISTLDSTVNTGAIALNPQRQFDGTAQLTSAAVLKVLTQDYSLTRTATFNVRVVANTANEPTVQWKYAEDSEYSTVLTLGDGTALFDASTAVEIPGTGVRIYVSTQTNLRPNNLYTFTVENRYGRVYLTGVADTAHQEIECSGKGTCDTSSGRCSCFNGYTGEACQRTVCPNSCSGHGVCQELRRFVADAAIAGVTYNTAFDAKSMMGCLCDAGFRGADCSLVECPSGGDPLGGAGGFGLDGENNLVAARDCSGRGVCDYSSGTCDCFKGYYGEACSEQTTLI